ncbi:hypothetical protein TNCV_235761 [Trichonephila clavipes]|nr:hypothetical protein TNCV_235761 [Trichonephila clavipes]
MGRASHSRPTRFNNGQLNFPITEVGGANACRVLPELYFSGSENVEDVLEGVDNNINFLEIPSDLACAYLKGRGTGRVGSKGLHAIERGADQKLFGGSE